MAVGEAEAGKMVGGQQERRSQKSLRELELVQDLKKLSKSVRAKTVDLANRGEEFQLQC
jgi:hypothetical protein